MNSERKMTLRKGPFDGKQLDLYEDEVLYLKVMEVSSDDAGQFLAAVYRCMDARTDFFDYTGFTVCDRFVCHPGVKPKIENSKEVLKQIDPSLLDETKSRCAFEFIGGPLDGQVEQISVFMFHPAKHHNDLQLYFSQLDPKDFTGVVKKEITEIKDMTKKHLSVQYLDSDCPTIAMLVFMENKKAAYYIIEKDDFNRKNPLFYYKKTIDTDDYEDYFMTHPQYESPETRDRWYLAKEDVKLFRL